MLWGAKVGEGREGWAGERGSNGMVIRSGDVCEDVRMEVWKSQGRGGESMRSMRDWVS